MSGRQKIWTFPFFSIFLNQNFDVAAAAAKNSSSTSSYIALNNNYTIPTLQE
jgi:hypothetical protein